jgi:hypothetical protein
MKTVIINANKIDKKAKKQIEKLIKLPIILILPDNSKTIVKRIK